MLSVVIPCLDEAESVPAFERELFPALDRLGARHEVLFVDDGSRDGTSEALSRLSQARVLSHGRNLGLGAALRTGFAAAQGDFAVALDADLTFHPRHIADLLSAQRASDADCVSGSPYLGTMAGVPWPRRLPSLALNAFYRGLFDRRLTSFTPMFRLYRTEALRAIHLESDGFEISAEILIRLLRAGRRVVEVPVPLGVRAAGASKLRRLRELSRHARLLWRLLVNP